MTDIFDNKPARMPSVWACFAAALLSGCASQGLPTGSTNFTPASGPEAELLPAGYALSPEEAEFDCKRLAGKVQIRILELRSRLSLEETSALSRTLQSATAATPLGGSTAGLDPKGERARDFAMLQAYNAQLANKNCRSFDLAKALSGSDTVPTPTVPARGG